MRGQTQIEVPLHCSTVSGKLTHRYYCLWQIVAATVALTPDDAAPEVFAAAAAPAGVVPTASAARSTWVKRRRLPHSGRCYH